MNLGGITSFFSDVEFFPSQVWLVQTWMPLSTVWTLGVVHLAVLQCFFFSEPYGVLLCNFQPETPEDPNRSLGLFLCVAPLYCSASQVPATSSPLHSKICLLMSAICLFPSLISLLSLWPITCLFSGACRFYLADFSCLRITVLHCLLFNIWKQLIHIFGPVFQLSIGSVSLVPVNWPWPEILGYYYRWGNLDSDIYLF